CAARGDPWLGGRRTGAPACTCLSRRSRPRARPASGSTGARGSARGRGLRREPRALMSSLEIEAFRIRFDYEFDRLLETIADLDDEAVNWKPQARGANSLLELETHALVSETPHTGGAAAG